jgi:hypothetical protein
MSTIQFPTPSGINCKMMPFIQGDSASIPAPYQPYADIINSHYLELGQVGYLTIQESFVDAGRSQRGYNSTGSTRNVHIEVGRRGTTNRWGSGQSSWGRGTGTLLADTTRVLIANSIGGTCRVWDDVLEMSPTVDGDLSAYLDRYPEDTGRLMGAGEVANISIFTPHECVAQQRPGVRQFFRIVGTGVRGREEYFTINPLVPAP